MRRDWAVAIVTTGALTLGGVALGYYAGSTDSPREDTVTVEVPTWAEPSYEDERYQDPSGFPYCDVTDPILPCLDVDAMGYLDLWGDEAIVIADHYVGDDWFGIGAFDCAPDGSDCRLIEPDDAPDLYESDPNLLVTTDSWAPRT
jgi:hypothetical protein